MNAVPAGRASPYAELASFFAPRSIAVIGASADPAKFGGRVLAYLLARHGDLAVHAVNARVPVCQGKATVGSIADIDAPVDLAILAVPAEACIAAIEACGRKGVPAAVVFTSGFSEAGGEGVARQSALLAAARQGGVRVLGPNCIGLVSEHDRIAATFATMWRDGWPAPGPVSVICQSGAFASYFHVLLRERGVGVARWATTGNEADVDVAEVIHFLAEDAATQVIIAAMEGVRDGRRLVRALLRARAADKPVILLKLGRSRVGSAAAQSHTGALAGEDRVFDAAVRDAGAIRCTTFIEAVDVATAFAVAPRPAGRRVGIVSASGGGGIMIADRADDLGLDVPALSAPLREELDAIIPGGNSRNPVDVTAMVLNDLDLMSRPLVAVAQSPEVDAVVAFLTSAFRSDASMQQLQARLDAAGLGRCGKPVLLSPICTPTAAAALHAAGMLAYPDPVQATNALAAMVRWVDGAVPAPVPRPDAGAGIPGSDASPIVANDEMSLLAHFATHGVRPVPGRLLRGADEIAGAYAEFGPRVVMKMAVTNLAHKSEHGGVVTGIASLAGARDAWELIIARAAAAGFASRMLGVVMQAQASGVVEMLLGLEHDPAFGPVVTVGMGGMWVELLDDVATALAPVDAHQARGMLERLRAAPLLAGARGRPAADIDALAQAIADFSRAGIALGTAASVEINPLIVGTPGAGVHAADAKMAHPE